MIGVFDDLGIRFEYPLEWELDVSEDGARTSISLQATGEPAFAMVALDGACPEPLDMADEALSAMREEYPGLDVAEVSDTIDGNEAVGYDLEFMSLDMASSCLIRGFRTPRRTVLVFAQWSDLDDEGAAILIRKLVKSLEETDS